LNSSRIWLFRGLVAAGIALILASWFSVWWRADILMWQDRYAQIRPYALEMDPFIRGYMPGAKLPDWMPPFVWSFFGAVMLAMVAGMFAPAKRFGIWKIQFPLSTYFISGVGVAFIVCAVVMAVYASIEMARVWPGMQLNALQTLEIDPETHSFSNVDARFLPGYYLAWAAGIYCIVLGLLSDKIKGVKPASAK
jgi:hypothetical protein